MKYVCLVHFSQDIFASLGAEGLRSLQERSAAYDEQLTARGQMLAAEALESPNSAVLVKVRNAAVSTTDGPFSETKEQLGGFILIEARDLNEAIRIASGIPLAELGTIEVRPVYTPPKHERAGS